MKDIKEYYEFLERKKHHIEDSGFSVEDSQLNPILFPFQKYCVKKALNKGKYALFEDCGLGKTIQQLEWASHIVKHSSQPVLIIAPLAVVGQTINEGQKFGYNVIELGGGGADHRKTQSISRTTTISRMWFREIIRELSLTKVRY